MMAWIFPWLNCLCAPPLVFTKMPPARPGLEAPARHSSTGVWSRCLIWAGNSNSMRSCPSPLMTAARWRWTFYSQERVWWSKSTVASIWEMLILGGETAGRTPPCKQMDILSCASWLWISGKIWISFWIPSAERWRHAPGDREIIQNRKKFEPFRHLEVHYSALERLVFRRFWKIFLLIEFFFDRLLGFAKVRPLFPITSQGCRVQSHIRERSRCFCRVEGGVTSIPLA